MHWFWRVLRNHTYDHLRKERSRPVRSREAAAETASALSWRSAGSEVDTERIWEMIKQMKYPEREVLLLYYGWAFNQREIADMLDLSHSNVRRIKLRALARLRARLVCEEETKR